MNLHILGGKGNPSLIDRINSALEATGYHNPQTPVRYWNYPDGERSLQIQENIRGGDIFIIQSMFPEQSERFTEMLFLIDAAGAASAKRITLVIPYLAYQRQDRKDKPRVPRSAKIFIEGLVSCATRFGGMESRALMLEMHTPQLELVFDCPIDHLSTLRVFSNYYANTLGLDPQQLVVVAPDSGSTKRAEKFASALSHLPPATIHKSRDPVTGKTKIISVAGDVAGKNVLLADDMIDTGGTLAKAASLLKEQGARTIYACCTHAVLSQDGPERIRDSAITQLCVTDSVIIPDHKRERLGGKLHELSVAPLLAEAIRRIHENKSVSALF